jgi:2-oxoisovalerate dehydrogenase E1 component
MSLSRRIDERFEALRLSGRVSKWYSAIGNEATTVPAGMLLEPGDVLCSLHRDLGAILAYYLDPARTFPGLGLPEQPLKPEPEKILYRLACQLLGKGDGFSQGVERSYHYSFVDQAAGLRHFGMISHLGSMIPVTAGCALASKLDQFSGVASNRPIAINFIGEGGTSTGDFHEALNIAAVWDLPMVLVIENNRYAFSTPARDQYRAERLSDRGLGYGMVAETVNGNDPDRVAGVLRKAVDRARRGEGPTLIEAMVGRMRGHAEGDDSLKVVPAEELDLYMRQDPVVLYRQSLLADGVLDEIALESLESRIDLLVESAIDAALDASPPSGEVAWRPALAPVPGESGAESVAERTSPVTVTTVEPSAATKSDDVTSYVDAIHRALEQELETDPTVFLMGQDIGRFEGAFRVTRGFHQRWPERVLDTPIAESGTMGIAAGAALCGYRPIVEMQFADFVSCGFNQIVNVLAKFYYRWQQTCPVVVRLPSGGGVGAGAFHSQNPEGWFTHVAGLKVVCPATAIDAWGLMRASIQDPNPVIFCEHKYLYRRVKEVLPAVTGTDFLSGDFALGRAAVRRTGSDVTLIGYGATVWTCLEAATALEASGYSAEVIDLRTLVPFDEATVLESVQKTGRAVVVHEAQMTSGFGAEVVARIADKAFAWLDAPVARVTYPDRPVPYIKALERQLLPNAEAVVGAARKAIDY